MHFQEVRSLLLLCQSLIEQETVVRLGGKPFDTLSHEISLINILKYIFFSFILHNNQFPLPYLLLFPPWTSHLFTHPLRLHSESSRDPMGAKKVRCITLQQDIFLTWTRLSKAFCIKIGSKKPAYVPRLCPDPTAMYPTKRPRYTMSFTSRSMQVPCRHPGCHSEVCELSLV